MAKVDNTDVIRALFNEMKRSDDLRQMVHAADPEKLQGLVTLYGYQGPLTPEDQTRIYDLSDMFQDLEANKKQKAQDIKDEENAAKEDARKVYHDAVGQIMQLDPRTKLLHGALTTAGEAAHAMGKASRNDGNRLAQAILEGQRSHSAKQDDIYGPSVRDKTNAMVAANTARRGENAGALWDAVGNAINKILGMEQQNDLTVRQMKMIPYDKEMNMSGNYYQMMNQDRKRAFNTGRE